MAPLQPDPLQCGFSQVPPRRDEVHFLLLESGMALGLAMVNTVQPKGRPRSQPSAQGTAGKLRHGPACRAPCVKGGELLLREEEAAQAAPRAVEGGILKEVSPGCSLEGLMLKRKLQYSGHLMRRADSFEKTLMLGGIGGRRRRGRQR